MKIKTAIILCAGLGKRLMPLTKETPKPLLKINHISLLENTINLIKELEIKHIKVNTFYLSEKIKDFISSKNFGL
ncbi:sugar phosphate nucleotidyltransferase, partial [Candidatus Pelagibacter sp.]|nr:sugar phosphate nucleotidyltransferase [Candidatus Pelagibacter sp.]